MDIASLAQTFKQVFEIFENTGVSQDTLAPNNQGTKTGGEPDKELVAEFENYLNEPNSLEQTDFKQGNIEENQAVKSIDTPEPQADINTLEPAEQLAKNQEIHAKTAVSAAETLSVEPQEYFNEIKNILTRLENNTLSTTELYRLQYLTNMLNVQITQNNSLSKSTTEQFETMLKQQG
jgi:hypothetical protein